MRISDWSSDVCSSDLRVVESRFSHCGECDFAFMSNPLSRESLEAYYRDTDQYRRANLTLEEARHIGEQDGIVARYIRGIENPRLLEVGADNGSFLELLRSRTGGVAARKNHGEGKRVS